MSIKIGRLIEVFFVWGVVAGVIFSLSGALAAVQGNPLAESNTEIESSLTLVQGNSVLSNSEHYYPAYNFAGNITGLKKINVAITAYSSCPTETDSDPYITASGQWVREGIVAANFLPFGTGIKIPELFGDEIFVVQDRMHARKKYQVDIWFPTKEEAIEFGAHYSYIELIEEI